jgi:hypothetical protein
MALKRQARTRCSSLVFFIALFLLSCGKPAPTEVEVQYDQGRAKAVVIPKAAIGLIPPDSITHLVSIRLVNSGSRILGSYEQDDQLTFTPLIPFTPGLRYEILLKEHKVGSFSIPEPDPSAAPVLTKIYPSPDTVPMNLLKMYLQFSKPMRSGEALKHITVIQSNGDTARGVFLDLQQELWNEDQTILTLWLDPGRIKRDLQPNKLFGNPLTENETYTLHVDRRWKDQLGSMLANDRIKTFYASHRDSISPLPSQWKLSSPKEGTKEPVVIKFGEPLDFSLASSAIHITKEGIDLIGSVTTGPGEKSWLFTPNGSWSQGDYIIEIESRLEDLAGNNLNRPFDRDMTTTSNVKNLDVVSLPFAIK